MEDLADVLTEFHPATGKVPQLDPLSQAHLPVARELSNADSLRLDDLLSAGSFAVLDAALHSICSVPHAQTVAGSNPGSSVATTYYDNHTEVHTRQGTGSDPSAQPGYVFAQLAHPGVGLAPPQRQREPGHGPLSTSGIGSSSQLAGAGNAQLPLPPTPHRQQQQQQALSPSHPAAPSPGQQPQQQQQLHHQLQQPHQPPHQPPAQPPPKQQQQQQQHMQ
ncbi:hypothetical protein VaNZ11_001364, partial [Volvox africanus]